MKADITLTPIPPFFSPQQINHLFAQSAIELLFVSDPSPARPFITGQVDIDEPLDCYWVNPSDTAESVLPQGTALVTYTSGTTGHPKGVCISTEAIDQVIISLNEATADIGVNQHLCLLPLAVMLENIAGVFLPLYAGASVLLFSTAASGLQGSSRLDIHQFAEFLSQRQPESLILTPELLKVLIHLCHLGLNLQQLKFVAVGGGKVAPALLTTATQLGIPVYEGYGLSECGSVVSLNLPGAVRIGSAGKPLSHCQISLAADGEIQVSGVTMLGYLGDERLNNSTIATGDLGTIDDDGYLHIAGRKKNVQINSFGRNFNPEWIESELNSLPGIIQCAMIGDQRPWVSAVIYAIDDLSNSQLETLLEQLNQQLPDYAQIFSWIRASTAFSIANGLATANGRIKREAIYQHYSQQLDNCYQDVSI